MIVVRQEGTFDVENEPGSGRDGERAFWWDYPKSPRKTLGNIQCCGPCWSTLGEERKEPGREAGAGLVRGSEEAPRQVGGAARRPSCPGPNRASPAASAQGRLASLPDTPSFLGFPGGRRAEQG